MDNIQRFWNIFQCVLEAIGEYEFLRSETVTSLIALFEDMMGIFNFAPPLIWTIIRFIRFAMRLFNFIQSLTGGSRSLEY